MPVHTLETVQTIAATLDATWDFFADPCNLWRITPPALDFTIPGDLPGRMYPGMMLRYRVRPLLGIAVTWVTEITHVEPGRFFVDEQRVGPYRMWHHEHHFRELPGDRVEITDRITYQLPFGWLSEPVHALIVRPQLARIFAYREKAVAQIFPCAERTPVGSGK